MDASVPGAGRPDRGEAARSAPSGGADSYSLAVVNNYVLYPVRSVNVRSIKAQDAKVRKPVSSSP